MKILKAVDSLNIKLSDYVAYVKDDYKEYNSNSDAFTIDAYDEKNEYVDTYTDGRWLYDTDENKYVVVDSSFESEEDEYNIVVRHV